MLIFRSDTVSSDSDDEFQQRILAIERDVKQRFEDIEKELENLRTNSIRSVQNQQRDDEHFSKLCHAVDYLLEQSKASYDTLACREMVLSLIGPRTARPFSGRTIRNRLLCKRVRRWCLFITLILIVLICMSMYGLHRNWSYLVVFLTVIGSIISSIGLHRIYTIIGDVW